MADNQPRDDHAKDLKQATSRAKQLRGWVATDPTRSEEFVDTLNAVTGLRLVSRLWHDAYTDATDAVGAATRLVASRGPVGPYTPVVDAARYVTALVHVATLQVGLGLPQAAGTTIDAAEQWAHQLTGNDLADHLTPRTLVWALLARSRAALADAQLDRANAWADAALVEARRAGLDDADTTVLLDALRAVADARWAVGLPDQSIALLDEALEIWDEWTHDDLEQLPRMAKGHLDRVVAPVFALRRDLADRLEAAGQADRSLAVRDDLGRLAHRTAARRGEPGRTDLALARADQAWALADAGRTADALRAAEDAVNALNALLKAERPVGQHLPTQALVAPAVAHAELAAGRTDAARRTIEGLFSRLQANPSVEVRDAVRVVALTVRAEAARSAGDDAAAAAHQAAADQLDAALRASLAATWGRPDALPLARSLARGVQLRSVEPTPYWEVPEGRCLVASTVQPAVPAHLSDEEAMRRIDEQREVEARERLAAEQAEAAERAERERRQAAERAAALAEAERRRAEQQAAAEQAAAEQEAAAEAERRRQEAERREQEQPAVVADVTPAQDQPVEDQAVEDQPVEQVAVAQEEAEAVRVAAERAEQERRDAEERARAEREAQARREQEQREQEQERRQAEAARLEQERVERERVEQERREREAAEQARRDQERREQERREVAVHQVDPLEELRTAAHRAVASGDKQRVVATHEQLVEALEPRAAADPRGTGRELVEALERLSDAQGWLRGRAAGKRAKQLAREFGLQ